MTTPRSTGIGYQCLNCGLYKHESTTARCVDATNGTEREEHLWDELRCIEEGGDMQGCGGPVEYRFGYGLKGAYARCVSHFDAYMDRMEVTNRRYPASPIPPADFDPTYAGERWNDED